MPITSPLIPFRGGDFYLSSPDHKEEQTMSEVNKENKEFTFENEQYRKTYWHTCSQIGRAHV